jgi:hypothetical protein
MPRGQRLISGYTKRLKRFAADLSIPMARGPISTTQEAGFDVSNLNGRIYGKIQIIPTGEKLRSQVAVCIMSSGHHWALTETGHTWRRVKPILRAAASDISPRLSVFKFD